MPPSESVTRPVSVAVGLAKATPAVPSKVIKMMAEALTSFGIPWVCSGITISHNYTSQYAVETGDLCQDEKKSVKKCKGEQRSSPKARERHQIRSIDASHRVPPAMKNGRLRACQQLPWRNLQDGLLLGNPAWTRRLLSAGA